MRKHINSGIIWENIVGYSRATRVNNFIEVSGTTAMDGNQLVGENDVYAQSVFIFKKIEKSLNDLGGNMVDVVRTRMFVTDITQWEAIGRAHGEFFSTIKPVTTMIEVQRLIKPEFLIEIEVTAIVGA